MDQNDSVNFVEEENSGWTILSAVPDGESGSHENMVASPNGADLPLASPVALSPGKVKNENEIHTSHGYQRNEVEKDSSDEAEKYADDDEGNDADDEMEENDLDAGGDEVKIFPESGSDDVKVFTFQDSERGFVWEPEPLSPKFVAKQALVKQQPGQKQGVMWRVSLVATIGFFGWAVMNGLSGGNGKNLRLKLHPCSIKEGEPILTTL